MNAPAVLELPLDDALLKVLSSESRREILRLLRERRMTGAELAARLELGKPAVAEHLKKLLDAQLIERFDDPERRWVYYNLSPRGRGILEPQRVRFYLVMAVAALGLMLGVALSLGLVVYMQGHGHASAALAGTSNEANSQAGGLANPGAGQVQGVLAPPTRQPASSDPSPSTAKGTATTPPTAAPPPQGNRSRPPQPVGTSTPAVAVTGPIVLTNSNVASLHLGRDPAVTTVLAYRPRDVDAANGTIHFHLLALNASQVRAANLTQAVQGAANRSVGLLLQVPDATALPEGPNGTATLSIQLAPETGKSAARNASVPPAATTKQATADGHTALLASETATGTAATLAPSSGTGQLGSQATTAAPSTATKAPATTNLQGGSRDMQAGLPSPGAANTVAPTPAVATLPVGSQAAPVPLVALLVAALAVSVYLPNRRA